MCHGIFVCHCCDHPLSPFFLVLQAIPISPFVLDNDFSTCYFVFLFSSPAETTEEESVSETVTGTPSSTLSKYNLLLSLNTIRHN